MLSQRRAGWWCLVLIIPLAGGLFVGEESLTVSSQAHTVMQAAIFLLAIGLMALWVRSEEPTAGREAASRLIVIDMLDVNTPDASAMPQRIVDVRPVRESTSTY